MRADISPVEGDCSLMVGLRLRGRRALVVGGGSVGTARARALAQAGAIVTVVTLRASAELRARARRGELALELRAWSADDDADIVCVAIDDPELSARIAAVCRERRVPVNVADRPEICDFYFPAVHRAGKVQVAVSTDGAGPGLAARLRDEIAAALHPMLAEAVDRFSTIRAALRATEPSSARRMRQLRQLGDRMSWAEMAGVRSPGLTVVGAGPGDPGLLTVAGREALRAADLVIADRLVPAEILALSGGEVRTPATAEEKVAQVVAGFRAGRRVVRLKIGDPSFFARAAEEMAAFAEAGIAADVIPGVTSACALGFPLTARGVADRVVFATAQGEHSFPELPAFTPDTTLVLFMGVGRLSDLQARLLGAGWPPEVPVAVVSDASRPGETRWHGALAGLSLAEGHSPGIVVVGGVTTRLAAMREAVSAYEHQFGGIV